MTAITRPPDVILRDVSYAYPDQSDLTLTGVSWEIAAGEFVVVSGPSGSGKSTMLRCLNGLVPHFSGGRFGGEARVFSIDTRLHGPRHLSQHVGFVFQDPESQSVAAIVEDDIAFGLEQAGLPRYEMRKRVEEVLDLLGISPLRSRAIATLSGGERQRVAIAGAMARRPELLVLDEPTSQLDPWGSDEVLTALHRLNDDLGLTIVLAEHRLDRVANSADVIRLLRADGGIADLEPSLALLEMADHDQPPLARLARRAGWSRSPLTIKAARRLLPSLAPVERESPNIRTVGPAIASATGVNIELGGKRVLGDIDLTLFAGQIVALMGRNGSGKTTLIRALLGMLPTAEGAITIAGQPVRAGNPGELAGIAAYLPQDPARLLFAETVRAEIDASLAHLPASHERRDPDVLLDAFDLTNLADRHPRDLSAGERERAALAAVLVGAPSFIALDEPTRGMDGTRKYNLMRTLDQERARGAAIVMATHDVELVAQWADRVILLGDGEIIADGDPHDVLAGSVTFSPQMNRLFGGTILTVDDAIAAFGNALVNLP